MDLAQIKASDFTDLLNEIFDVIDAEQNETQWKLVNVTAYEQYLLEEMERTPFRLLFESIDGKPLPDGCVVLRHEMIEPLPSVFVNRTIPPSINKTAPYYQVMFS